MKLDKDLIKKILIAIEEQNEGVAIYDLKIEGYDLKTVAHHCDKLFEKGLISDYRSQYADDKVVSFGVGSLTLDGYDYLEKKPEIAKEIIIAVEKQNEKKVIFEDLDSIICCPNCGIDLLKFERYNEFYKAKYCPECGQCL